MLRDPVSGYAGTPTLLQGGAGGGERSSGRGPSRRSGRIGWSGRTAQQRWLVHCLSDPRAPLDEGVARPSTQSSTWSVGGLGPALTFKAGVWL